MTWYTWLEQGRDISASPQVIDALARALALTGDEHQHLRALAGLPAPENATAAGEELPRLQRLVDAAAPNIACVYDLHFDYLAWNVPYARIRHDPGPLPPSRRNLMWMMFTDAANRARMLRWEQAARTVLGQFRAAAGQRPDDPRFAEIVAALSDASTEFREVVGRLPGPNLPARNDPDPAPAGRPITLELFQLRLAEHPGLLMVMQTPASAEDLARITALSGSS